MKIYRFHRKQFLPISLESAWTFFSSPQNLKEITPTKMDFKIGYQSVHCQMYAGQIICYSVKIMPFISVQWVTEITHVNAPFYFVDEQRVGPYSLWHHQHHFIAVDGGIEMIDELNYAIPFGWIGRLINALFVRREVKAIFDFRSQVLSSKFLTNVIEIKL